MFRLPFFDLQSVLRRREWIVGTYGLSSIESSIRNSTPSSAFAWGEDLSWLFNAGFALSFLSKKEGV